MKIKRILSSALVVIMLFTSIVGFIPVKADAAYDSTNAAASLTSDEIKTIVKAALEYNFSSAEEMLVYEQTLGYLDRVDSADKAYSIYVNRYTGVLYYVNNVTGQILTSSPYDIGYKNEANGSFAISQTVRQKLLSQINIEFVELATNAPDNYNSTDWGALYAQISTEYIVGGIRVNYTLGDTSARFLLPGRMLAKDFEALIIVPMIEKIENYMEEYCKEALPEENFKFFENEEKYADAYEYGHINSSSLKKYLSATLTSLGKAVKDKNSIEYKNVNTLVSNLRTFTVAYTLKNPLEFEEKGKTEDKAYTDMIKNYYTNNGGAPLEIYETHEAMYVFKEGATVEEKRSRSLLFRKYADGYTFSQMFEDEKLCGYVDETEVEPVFRCALEYTLNADGTLAVRLPANSISFDETTYYIERISTLMYFGAGDLYNEGYIFMPDGSGSVTRFDKAFNESEQYTVNMDGKIFGNDYCYSDITGTHREAITMPVYGLVAETNANPITKNLYGVDTVMNGYFAIIEDGESTSQLQMETGAASYKYGSVYAKYDPNPHDKFTVSETTSSTSNAAYTVVAESKYTGSYVTRIVMLCDDAVGKAAYGEGNYPVSSYVGMAGYYRSYLEKNGVIKAIENVNANLPLYIESFGSMEIMSKFLSFPITKKIPLTEFSDVLEMYKNFAENSSATLKAKADNYTALATEQATRKAEYEALKAASTDAEKNAEYDILIQECVTLKAEYESVAAYYATLAKDLVINNVNFRLTGFGNGGMEYTYPTKVRWDRACGGASEFNKLVEEAKKLSTGGANLGIYPEYDFMYINNTAMFDGIVVKGNVSRMVDNRYASKQTYNAVLQDMESFYTLVINPESLDKIYNKFIKQYSKYDLHNISVSTLGSDLNSNFDEDAPVNRDDAEAYIEQILGRIKTDGYDIMTDVGNIYAVKYVNHILNATTDSSHHIHASYTVPFFGMVLHGYVNYTGTPLNYSGTPAYDILRSIENGAALYYILCYQNTAYMKDDKILSKYYGVDYTTWFESVVESYAELNSQIGDLQSYKIVDHRVILGERVIEESEAIENLETLKAEILVMLDTQISAAIDAGYEWLKANEAGYGRPLEVVVSKESLMTQFADILNVSVEELGGTAEAKTEFSQAVDAIIAKYTSTYPTGGVNPYTVSISSIEYNSQYSFITESVATDKNYIKTDYTSDTNNIVIVTYSNGTDTVKFVLNYNIYSVTVNLGADGVHELGKYGYVRIG